MGVVTSAVRGALAGVVATTAMDLVWYRRYRAGGGDRGFAAWEFSTPAAGFDDAPAPARVGKVIADAVGVTLPASAVSATNNAVHWITGIGWGKVAGLAAAALPVSRLGIGVVTGASAWLTSYAALGRLGIYRPITEYDGATLRRDLGAHLVFGTALGAALRVADGRRPRA